MALIVRLLNAAFTYSLGKLGVGDPDAVQAVTYLGDGGASAFDITNGGVGVTGAPTYEDAYADLAATDSFDTGVQVGNGPYTLITVQRFSTPSGIKILFSSYGQGHTTGYLGFIWNAALRFAYKSNPTTSALVTMNGFRSGAFGFYGARMSSAGVLDLFSGIGGAMAKQTTAVAVGAAYGDTVQAMKVNAVTTSSTSMDMDVAYTAIYDRDLSDAEMLAQYDALRAYFDTRLPNTL